MAQFITRSKRDPNTGMIVYEKSEITKPVEPTVDELRKEIQMLKNALIKMVELQAENKTLKEKVAELKYRLSRKVPAVVLPEPTKDQLIAVAEAIPELAESKAVTTYYKNNAGAWVEGPKPRGPRKKNPTT